MTEAFPLKTAETRLKLKFPEKLPKLERAEISPPLSGRALIRFLWDNILLPLIVMVPLAMLVYALEITNPNIILITGLAVFTSLYGYGAGAVCGAVMVSYSMYFFSIDHSLFLYTPVNLQKILVILLGSLMNILFIGRLRKRKDKTERRLMRMNEALKTDNSVLEAASLTDPLTGTRNRFALRRDYNQYEEKRLHVMMFDLDDFKKTNDAYGHAVGDYVLKHTGRLLRRQFGDSCCYRYGGDEFLIIRAGMEEKAFAAKVEALRQGMREIALDKQPLPTFFSAGYVYGKADLSIDLRLMLRHADHNLYRAKELGKNGAVGSLYSRSLAEKLEADLPPEGKSFSDLTE